MRVGADDDGRAPVDEIAERLLLARRLGVEVDEDGVGALLEPAGGELSIDRAERIVELGHEDAAHGVDDQHVRTGLRLEYPRAAAGRSRRIVDGAQQPGLALDEDERLLLVEGVVAERHHVGAGLQDLLEDGLGDAEAAGRVLAVDGDEIERDSGGAGRAAPR